MSDQLFLKDLTVFSPSLSFGQKSRSKSVSGIQPAPQPPKQKAGELQKVVMSPKSIQLVKATIRRSDAKSNLSSSRSARRLPTNLERITNYELQQQPPSELRDSQLAQIQRRLEEVEADKRRLQQGLYCLVRDFEGDGEYQLAELRKIWNSLRQKNTVLEQERDELREALREQVLLREEQSVLRANAEMRVAQLAALTKEQEETITDLKQKQHQEELVQRQMVQIAQLQMEVTQMKEQYKNFDQQVYLAAKEMAERQAQQVKNDTKTLQINAELKTIQTVEAQLAVSQRIISQLEMEKKILEARRHRALLDKQQLSEQLNAVYIEMLELRNEVKILRALHVADALQIQALKDVLNSQVDPATKFERAQVCNTAHESETEKIQFMARYEAKLAQADRTAQQLEAQQVRLFVRLIETQAAELDQLNSHIQILETKLDQYEFRPWLC